VTRRCDFALELLAILSCFFAAIVVIFSSANQNFRHWSEEAAVAALPLCHRQTRLSAMGTFRKVES
jgi:hypothetical protein